MRIQRIHVVKPLLLALAFAAGAILLVSAPRPTLTVHQKAYYLSPEQANFIRPGLVIQVTGAEIAADGTIRATVKLTDPKGQPLDREGVFTPGTISVSLIAAYIPQGQKQYMAYTTRSATSPITNVTAVQAGADSGGKFQKTGDGEYLYTFKTKAPAGFDAAATHTIGAYGSRNLAEFDLGTQYADTVYNFVPNGSAVTTVRDVIRTATCNKCHDQMAFHGGPRRSLEVCILCHTPQTTDPDTGNTLDMVVMTHKIHMGSQLPSVVAGGKYQIIGHNQSVADYSEVVFPADPRNCQFCHEPGATQSDAMLNANRAACGACHDDVNFATGENHVDQIQLSDKECTRCHVKQGELEFDASILGAHTIPRFSSTLKGVVLNLISVEGSAGSAPVVKFSIKDKAGNDIPLSTMARLNLVLAGPTTDYSTYVSENALKAPDNGDGTYTYTFTKALAADARGTYTVGIEGRRNATLLPGTKKEQTIREVGFNKIMNFSVDGSAVQPRRTIVSLDKCNACHNSLSLHGDNRNAIEQCVLCHNPNTATTGDNGTTVAFDVMVHRIHSGRDLTRPYKVGNTSFAEVGYPGDRRNCEACHVNGSEQPGLSQGLLQVSDPSSPLTPMQPVTAACTGCHDALPVLSHALTNVNNNGEACIVCHGADSEQSVNKAHAR